MMRYDSFEYLWPPRPEEVTAPIMLGALEAMGMVCQVKKNGTCSVVAISPEGDVIAMNRHKEVHKAWVPSKNSFAALKSIKRKGWFVFVGELLHSKVPGLRDVHYLFDILVEDGEYLVGKTFEEREARLQALFPEARSETFSHRVIDDHIWVAKLITSGYRSLFDGLVAPEDEGLVLKDPEIKLAICGRQSANTAGQVKCRKPTKNFAC